MNNGWVKVHRSLADSPLWLSEPFTRGQAWADLILLANHKDGYIRARGVRIEVKRGQVGMSVVKLSERWKWSRGKAIRFLDEMENDKQIVQQKNNVSSLTTITNYEEYQSNGTADSTASDTANGQQTGSKQNTNKKNNNNKNVKNEEEKIKMDLDFQEFWNLYDNKKSRPKAEAAYIKARKKTDKEKIHSQVKIYKLNLGTTSIMHPTSWLNAERWTDEYKQDFDKIGNNTVYTEQTEKEKAEIEALPEIDW